MAKGTNLPSKPTEAEAEPDEIIERQIERVLEGKVQRRDISAVTARITELVVSEQFYGPMPHPRHFRQYEEVLPGSAERLMSMAENAMDHNTSMSKRMAEAEIDDAKRGMRYGAFLFALLIVSAFASLFVTDSELVPGLFLGAAAIGAVGAFIKGRTGG